MEPSGLNAAPPYAATLWALMCATSALAANFTTQSGSSEQLTQQLAASVRYLPLPRLQASATTLAPRDRRKRGSRPSLSNSERGRVFRAKQQQYEFSLLQQVTDLQFEARRLERVSRDLRNECALQTRETDTGSLVRLVRLYHKIFRIGSPEIRTGAKQSRHSDEYADLRRRQHEFLHHAVDPDLQLGKQRGVGALAELWKRYTKYHENLRTSADTVEVFGPAESPVIVAHGTMQARYTRETLECLFPHVMHNEALVQRFIGIEVVYTYRNTYIFSTDGRLVMYTPEVDFIQSLIRAGASLADVSMLMQQARIADQFIVGPVAADGTISSTIEEIPEADTVLPTNDAQSSGAERSKKLRVDYLLD